MILKIYVESWFPSKKEDINCIPFFDFTIFTINCALIKISSFTRKLMKICVNSLKTYLQFTITKFIANVNILKDVNLSLLVTSCTEGECCKVSRKCRSVYEKRKTWVT